MNSNNNSNNNSNPRIIKKTYAKLLKAVVLEDLEAEDVKYTNEHGVRSLELLQRLVDLLDDEVEHAAVDGASQSVLSSVRLVRVLRHVVRGHLLETGAAHVDDAEEQRLLERKRLDLQQGARPLQRVLVGQRGLTLDVLESDVAEMKDARERVPDAGLDGRIHLHDPHRVDDVLEVLGVVHPVHLVALALAQIPEVLRLVQLHALLHRGVRAVQEVVERVEVTLADELAGHTGLFQQVVADLSAARFAIAVEVDLKVLAKARAVVVAQRLRVTERLEQRVGLKDNVLHVLDAAFDLVAAAGHLGDKLHDELRRLRLAGSRLTGNDDAL